LIGAGAIRAAFEAMFGNGTVQAHPEHIHKVDSLASAMHHLVERVEVLGTDGPQTAYVIATNVYHKTPQGWRMVAHHASPGTPNAPQEMSSTPSVLH
jgi:ketosteroid isomerase-like protein